MMKLHFIFNIVKKRVSNIFLLTIMFASLLLIFMVGFSVKDIFYEYLRSSYGNIPDLKVKLNNLSDQELKEIKNKITALDYNIDILYGYEDIYNISVTDNEDLVLTNDMPVFIKGLNLKNYIELKIDGRKLNLEIENFEYDDSLLIEINLGQEKVLDKDSIQFMSKTKEIVLGFCSKSSIENNTLIFESTYCKDEIDVMFDDIEGVNAENLELVVDGKKYKAQIKEVDSLDRTIILSYPSEIKLEENSIKIQGIELTHDNLENFEFYDEELIVTFKRNENQELEYKRFIKEIVKNYVNFNRLVLDVESYVFIDDEENNDDVFKEELNYLNELTDFLDLIVKYDSYTAISSSYLAKDLNNLGVLNGFTIESKDISFTSSIRSTFLYNPEKIYDKNILIFNKNVLKREFNVGDENNFLDIYFPLNNKVTLSDIKQVVSDYDTKANYILQGDIIPSIAPKKEVFHIVIISFSILIFSILFIAMFVVLKQFYSNYASEMALLKLFGVHQPFQTYINIMSFTSAALVIFYVLKYEEHSINEIMMQYFFTKYNFDISNYFISLSILLVYILVIYLLEIMSMKKLNLIKGQ